MAVNPPKPGRYTPKCPKCANPFVFDIRVTSVEDDRAATEKEKKLAEWKADEGETTMPSGVAKSRPRQAPVDPDSTFASQPNSGGTDPDSTFASKQSAGAFDPEATEASAGAVRRDDDDGDKTSVQPAAKPKSKKPSGGEELPEKFGGYEVVKQLGKGGMGAVYLARQLSLDRNVALKTMNAEWAQDPVFISRFVREAYAAAQLTHHNVVQIYELGKESDVNYFSMEYVDGKSLGDLLKKNAGLSHEEAVGYIIQAARGLKFAHDRGMVHRDIKPDNLMLNTEGIVKVADLGLVKTRAMTRADDAISNAQGRGGSIAGLNSLPDVTRVGSAMGSPSYMAPEQCRDAATVDGRADIYSLGCTLYSMLAGRAPFQGKTAVELIAKHLNEAPPPLRNLVDTVDAELGKIVDKTLKKSPDERYQSMDEFIGALKNWQQDRVNGPPKATEVQLAAFEVLTHRLGSSLPAKLNKILPWAAPLVGLALASISIPFSLPFAGALFVCTLAAVLGGFFASGLLTNSIVFQKLRQWAFGAKITDWLTAVVAVLLFFLGLYFADLILFGIIALVVGVGLGIGYAFAIAKPVRDGELATKEEIEKITKRLRLAGMDEDGVRQFVVQNAGDKWEHVFETLYGYPAKVQACGLFAEKVQNRPKYAGWRDAIVDKIDAITEARQQAKSKKLLQKMEVARLKAEGATDAEAAAKAEDAADELVEQAVEIKAANADKKKKVDVRELMTRYQKVQAAPKRKRKPFALILLGKLLRLPFDSRLRLVLGAALVVGALMWLNQNVKGATDIASVDASTWNKVSALVMDPTSAKGLTLGWAPKAITGFFDCLNPLIAGLLLLFSALASKTRTVLAIAFSAAVAFAGHKVLELTGVALPELGPLKPSHVSGLAGLILGVLSYVLLGRR